MLNHLVLNVVLHRYLILDPLQRSRPHSKKCGRTSPQRPAVYLLWRVVCRHVGITRDRIMACLIRGGRRDVGQTSSAPASWLEETKVKGVEHFVSR